MDKTINHKKRFKIQPWIILLVLGILGVFWLAYSLSSSSSLDIEASQIETASVLETNFEEAITVTSEVIPSRQRFIDASESGTVEALYAKSGDELNRGDTIVILSNSDLQLEVLQRESQLMEQLNTQRQTRILLNQNDLSQKQQIEEVNYQLSVQEKRYERNKILFDKKVIAKQDFEEITKRYNYLKKRREILKKVYRTDSIARTSQLQQLNDSEVRLTQNLIAVQNILKKLCITAPMQGKLSDFSFSPGELVNEGQRIGIVYTIDPPKLEAFVDELYINDIQQGLSGKVNINGNTHQVKVSKKYPGVEDGNFKIELLFEKSFDQELYNGQTLRVQLNLSAPKQALVIPKGRFYSNTGGQWIFVLNGNTAEKREINLGQQNDQYYEVKSGLSKGDEVIISNYDNYQNYNTLKINKS